MGDRKQSADIPVTENPQHRSSEADIYANDTTASSFSKLQAERRDSSRGSLDLKLDKRRYSVQCVTDYQKMPHRPSLYGYPPPSTKLTLSLGTGPRGSETTSAKSSFAERGSIQEEPLGLKSQMKSVKSGSPEENIKLGREPVAFRCQTCQQPTMTVTTYHVGVMTWIASVLIFLCGGILGCFLIPFYTNCCKDVKHTCPVCETDVGVVKCI